MTTQVGTISTEFTPTEYSSKMYWVVNEKSGQPYMRMLFPLCGFSFGIYFYIDTMRLVLVNRDFSDVDTIDNVQTVINRIDIQMEYDSKDHDIENAPMAYYATINFCGAVYDIDVITPELEEGRAKRGCFGTLRIRRA